jgi:hypothetical protein
MSALLWPAEIHLIRDLSRVQAAIPLREPAASRHDELAPVIAPHPAFDHR